MPASEVSDILTKKRVSRELIVRLAVLTWAKLIKPGSSLDEERRSSKIIGRKTIFDLHSFAPKFKEVSGELVDGLLF